MRTDLVLKRPIITEKTMLLAQSGQFTFIVDKDANKQNIAAVVESAFKVKVVEVRTNTTRGKSRRFGKKRQPVLLSDTKKAIVVLKKGQKIDYFDIVEEK